MRPAHVARILDDEPVGNAELVQKKIELERSVKDLESFSYTVAHDLRSPMVSISGFAQLLLEPRSLRGQHLRRLRPMAIADDGTRYEQLVRITDHVAGMTDNYAVRLYRELRGMRYPGGRD